MATVESKTKFALCIHDADCDDLEKGMVYLVRPDDLANSNGYLRVVDLSGEDYLYPNSYFVIVDLPQQAQDALLASNS